MSNPAVQEIRLLVVDDHAMFREGLGEVLAKEPDMTVVGTCESAANALTKLDSARPSLVLLDFDLGSERGFDFIVGAKRREFQGKILVLTAGVSDQEAIQLVRAGANGIVHKHNTTEVLCGIIRQTA